MYFRPKSLGGNEKTGVRLHQQRATQVMERSEKGGGGGGEMVRSAAFMLCAQQRLAWEQRRKKFHVWERRWKRDLVISLTERARSSPTEQVGRGGWRQPTAHQAPSPSAGPQHQEGLWPGGCQRRCRWAIIREKQLGRGQGGGHDGRQIEEERRLGRGYHPRRSLSQPLIVACVHWSKSTIC